MAPGEKINLELDADMVDSARKQLGEPVAGLDDASVVERALNAYLLRRTTERARAGAEISSADAEQIAYEELRASRLERRGAA